MAGSARHGSEAAEKGRGGLKVWLGQRLQQNRKKKNAVGKNFSLKRTDRGRVSARHQGPRFSPGVQQEQSNKKVTSRGKDHDEKLEKRATTASKKAREVRKDETDPKKKNKKQLFRLRNLKKNTKKSREKEGQGGGCRAMRPVGQKNGPAPRIGKKRGKTGATGTQTSPAGKQRKRQDFRRDPSETETKKKRRKKRKKKGTRENVTQPGVAKADAPPKKKTRQRKRGAATPPTWGGNSITRPRRGETEPMKSRSPKRNSETGISRGPGLGGKTARH